MSRSESSSSPDGTYGRNEAGNAWNWAQGFTLSTGGTIDLNQVQTTATEECVEQGGRRPTAESSEADSAPAYQLKPDVLELIPGQVSALTEISWSFKANLPKWAMASCSQ